MIFYQTSFRGGFAAQGIRNWRRIWMRNWFYRHAEPPRVRQKTLLASLVRKSSCYIQLHLGNLVVRDALWKSRICWCNINVHHSIENNGIKSFLSSFRKVFFSDPWKFIFWERKRNLNSEWADSWWSVREAFLLCWEWSWKILWILPCRCSD